MKFLFVDDDEDILKTCKALWEEESKDLAVETSSSSKKAFKKIQKNEYDAIIADYAMPKLNGLELLKKLRKREIKTPYVILTGEGDEDIAKKALNYEADLYLKKGTNPRKKIHKIKDKLYSNPVEEK